MSTPAITRRTGADEAAEYEADTTVGECEEDDVVRVRGTDGKLYDVVLMLEEGETVLSEVVAYAPLHRQEERRAATVRYLAAMDHPTQWAGDEVWSLHETQPCAVVGHYAHPGGVHYHDERDATHSLVRLATAEAVARRERTRRAFGL